MLLEFFFSGSISLFASELDEHILGLAKNSKMTALEAPATVSLEMLELGRSLFSDKILSGNRNFSCASCHDQNKGTGDGRPLPFGENGQLLPRNTQPLYNLGQQAVKALFWDGRVSKGKSFGLRTPEPALNGKNPPRSDIANALTSALAAQTLFPMVSFAEMRGLPGTNEIADAKDNLSAWQLLLERLLAQEGYRQKFSKAFSDVPLSEINIGHVGRALAEFIGHEFNRSNTPWDRYLRGEMDALGSKEKRGALVFLSQKARCVRCHNGPHLSDFENHTIAFPQIGPGQNADHSDWGGFVVRPVSNGTPFSFRTPPLRNIALTAPYTHSGAYLTIRQVLNHYMGQAKALEEYSVAPIQDLYNLEIFLERKDNPLRLAYASQDVSSPAIQLDEQEIEDLIYFLENSLTGP